MTTLKRSIPSVNPLMKMVKWLTLPSIVMETDLLEDKSAWSLLTSVCERSQNRSPSNHGLACHFIDAFNVPVL